MRSNSRNVLIRNVTLLITVPTTTPSCWRNETLDLHLKNYKWHWWLYQLYCKIDIVTSMMLYVCNNLVWHLRKNIHSRLKDQEMGLETSITTHDGHLGVPSHEVLSLISFHIKIWEFFWDHLVRYKLEERLPLTVMELEASWDPYRLEASHW